MRPARSHSAISTPLAASTVTPPMAPAPPLRIRIFVYSLSTFSGSSPISSGLKIFRDHILDAGSPIGFADTVEARIGLNLDQVPIPGAAHDHALDVRDLDLAPLG